MADNHYMDELARQHLAGYEADFEPGDWAAMETMLNKKRNRRAAIWWPLSGAAAALLVWTVLTVQHTTEQETQPVSPASATVITSATDQDAVDLAIQELSTATDANSASGNPVPDNTSSTPAVGGRSADASGRSNDQPAIQGSGIQADSRSVANESTTGANRDEIIASLSDLDFLEKARLTASELSVPVADEWLIGSRNWAPKASGIQWLAGVYGQAELQQVTNLAVGGGQGIWVGLATHGGWQISAGLGTQTMRYDEPGNMDTIDGRIHLNTRGTLTYLDIPLQVQYQLPISRKWAAFGSVSLHGWKISSEEYVVSYRDVSNFPTSTASALYEYTIQLSGTYEASSFPVSNSLFNGFTMNTKDDYMPEGVVWATAISGGVGYLIHPRMQLQAGFRYQAPLQPLGIEQKKFRSAGLSAAIRYRLR